MPRTTSHEASEGMSLIEETFEASKALYFQMYYSTDEELKAADNEMRDILKSLCQKFVAKVLSETMFGSEKDVKREFTILESGAWNGALYKAMQNAKAILEGK